MKQFDDMVKNAKYISVYAGVRYWEDSKLNDDYDETMKMPFIKSGMWCPTIELATGKVMDWPIGNTASIHYKVCDAGSYYLLDDNGTRILGREDGYVPNKFLCHGDSGWGDYIIFKIDSDGYIQNYTVPTPEEDDWKIIDD